MAVYSSYGLDLMLIYHPFQLHMIVLYQTFLLNDHYLGNHNKQSNP